MIETAHLTRIRFHDRAFPKGHLTVARYGDLVPLFDCDNGCCVECHIVYTPLICSAQNFSNSIKARSASIRFFSGLRVRRGM